MAHLTVRVRQTKLGLKWTVTQAAWQSGQDKVKEEVVTETALRDLGFSENMTPAQAREHAKKLNALDKVRRKETKAKVRASERLHDLVVIESSLVPEELSKLFVVHLEREWAGGVYNLRKQIQHWNVVQKLVTTVNVQPHEYLERKNEIYRYFEEKKMGRSYVQKVLKVLNQWGAFYARQTKTYFEKVPSPTGQRLQRIKTAALRANEEGAAPMTVEILNHLKGRLPAEKWNYLHASLWFGFRPSELDTIIVNTENMRIEKDCGITILGIYQGKLTAIDEGKRWRWVPCIHSEQDKALQNLLNGAIQKLTVKTIRNHSPTSAGELGLYSGRKGFTDLMLSLGQSLEDVSQWMGHASIERTWKHYKNKKKVHFKKLSG